MYLWFLVLVVIEPYLWFGDGGRSRGIIYEEFGETVGSG